MVSVILIVFSEIVAVSTNKRSHADRCLKYFVKGSRASLWKILVLDNGFGLTMIPFSGLMSFLIILFSDHETLLGSLV